MEYILKTIQNTYKLTRSRNTYLQLGASLSASLLLTVTEQPTQDLTGWALRNHVDETNATLQPLVASLVLLHMFDNGQSGRFVVETRRWRLDDYGLRDFPGIIIRDTDDGAVCDSRMRKKVGLEFSGRNLQTLEYLG